MSTTKWDGGVIPSTAINADNTTKVQSFTVTALEAGKRRFTLSLFAYALGTNSLRVSLNGNTQRIGIDIFEIDPVTFDFDIGLVAGDIVYAEGLVGSVATQSAEASAAAAAGYAALAQGYLAAIQALNPPSLPLSIVDGGTGQVTNTAAFDALSPTTTKGDLIVSTGASNIRLPAGPLYHILVPDPAQANGVIYRGNKPIFRDVRNVISTINAMDGGKEVVITTPIAGFTQTIDLATNLYPGWKVWIKNGDTPISLGLLKVTLSGADTFSDSAAANSMDIPIGGMVELQCDGVGVFSILSKTNCRHYFKLREQRASGAVPAGINVGLNDRTFNTVLDNTTGDNPLVTAPFITLTYGVWNFNIRAVHTTSAPSRLGLYNQIGGTLFQFSLSNSGNFPVNHLAGRIQVTTATRAFQVREYYQTAGGALGTPCNDGNPEVYAEAEFWKE